MTIVGFINLVGLFFGLAALKFEIDAHEMERLGKVLEGWDRWRFVKTDFKARSIFLKYAAAGLIALSFFWKETLFN